ncbi:potassium channel subfamily K member 13-like [Branchiostoma lanceolatum]|uniref:potassium channel subfamily K member 13-like n=1 Tax=Branchiostoma lanceolatum TaxID=7740 RepID=UPI0034539376
MAAACCCCSPRLNEDNARFILLAFFITGYMLIGAAIFAEFEYDKEQEDREEYDSALALFRQRYPDINISDLNQLLEAHADASSRGLLTSKRPRWDFPGAFYFVGTVVSTIGFGMTTPQTDEGKIFLLFYGLFGCASTILFFNLFLERIITCLAYCMKKCHERDLRRKGLLNQQPSNSRSSEGDSDSLEAWKPSVYWVMLYLGVAAIAIACSAAAMYSPVENWTYLESIYFCFIAFSTIGFGDYVASQNVKYQNQPFYRFGNFIFILIGACCIYSLFNVISIIIKQFLTWIIRKTLKYCCRCCKKKQQPKGRPRRNAITPGHLKRRLQMQSKANHADNSRSPTTDVPAPEPDRLSFDSDDSDSRRMSGEMISMRDFLASNKVSLAIMQKQLSETANHARAAPPPRHTHSHSHYNGGGLAGGVGALAILNSKLAGEANKQ